MKVSKKQQEVAEAGEEQGMEAYGSKKEGVGEAEAAEEGRTAVVGVQMDAQSRALLTWALVNVATAGDRVVAVHVVVASAAEAAAAVDFDAMLGVYEGFCNLKQINLKVKICKDSSVRKALVREAGFFGASKLVVGVAKKKRAIASSLSIAKYCAKKLPAKCAVLAVKNGKIVFQREANDGSNHSGRGHSGKVSAELPGCGDNEMYCVLPFQASHHQNDSSPSDQPKDGGDVHDGSTAGGQPEGIPSEEHQISSMDPADAMGSQPEGIASEEQQVLSVYPANAMGSQPEEIASEEQQISSMDPTELLRDQVCSDADAKKCEGSTTAQEDETADLPAEGTSILYCVLPPRNGHSGRNRGDSEHSTSSHRDNDLIELATEGADNNSIELPTEGAGELYCLLPPKHGHSDRSSGDSRRSTVSQNDLDSADMPPKGDGDGELYCLLPRNEHSGRSSGGSKRSSASKRAFLHSGSFSSDIPLNSKNSPNKDCLDAEESSKEAAQNAETPSSSPTSVRRMLEGKSDRCRLRRSMLNHKRSSSFEWAKISMVQWAMRLPSRYTSVRPDGKSLKSDESPRLNCDSECESNSVAESESVPSFSFYDVAWPPKEFESLKEKYSSVCRLFSYEELKLATSNFSRGMLIGKGGTSQVYKAQLLDGKLSAVKMLKPSVDALQEFITEIKIVTSLQHENVVSLRGLSFENYSLLLVYDYLLQGSLDKALHGKHDGNHILSWDKRNRIAIGIAKALDFLHHGGVTQSVIHGDVKSSNVLLSEDFEAQLCDFGLAKQVSASTPHLTCTDISGTFGYLAPEYFSYGKVNEKIDVYAYGVVLLEIISGRRPIRTGCAKGQENLVVWATPLLSSGEIKQVVDPGLQNDYDCDEMELMTLAASLCTRTSAQARPKMSLVLKLLQGDDETIVWARSQVSAGYDGSDDDAGTLDSNIQSHMNLALLGVEEDRLSGCSTEQTMDTSADDIYWSRSSSFD